MTVVLVLSPVRHQTCIVPSRNHEPSSELLQSVRSVCPNFRQTCQFLYHIILVAWHYINQGFMCFWYFLLPVKDEFGVKWQRMVFRINEKFCSTNTTFMSNFGKFSGVIWPFKAFKWFSSHLMTVIEIWTTCTCNS